MTRQTDTQEQTMTTMTTVERTHVGTCRGCGARVTGTPVDRKALAFAQGGDDLHAARCVTSTGTVRTDGAPRPLA